MRTGSRDGERDEEDGGVEGHSTPPRCQIIHGSHPGTQPDGPEPGNHGLLDAPREEGESEGGGAEPPMLRRSLRKNNKLIKNVPPEPGHNLPGTSRSGEPQPHRCLRSRGTTAPGASGAGKP